MQFNRVDDNGMKQAQDLIFENGTVWAVSTSGWSGNDRLEAEDLGIEEKDVLDIFRLGNKKLLPDAVRIRLHGARSQVQGLMMRVGRPFFIRGCYFVPDKSLLGALEGLKMVRLRQEQEVSRFLDGYESMRWKMISDYPVLESAAWPTPEQIRARFAVKWVVFQVTGTEARSSDPEELIQAKREFQAELKGEYENLKTEILKEAHVALVDACRDIAERILQTGEKITETTLKKPRGIIDQYLAVASLFDSQAIRREVEKLQEVVDGASAKSIRERPMVARTFAASIKSLGESIGDLSGYSSDGRMKRRLDLGGKPSERENVEKQYFPGGVKIGGLDVEFVPGDKIDWKKRAANDMD